MSLREKMRHQPRSGGKVRSFLHKHDGHKMATVVNHVHFERQHGYESSKRSESPADQAAS